MSHTRTRSLHLFRWSQAAPTWCALLLLAYRCVITPTPVAFGFTMEKIRIRNINRKVDAGKINSSTLVEDVTSDIHSYVQLHSTQKILLDQVDEVLDANIVGIEKKKHKLLQRIDETHENDLDLCAAFGTEYDISNGKGEGEGEGIEFPPYEYVYSGRESNRSKRPLAIQTIDEACPVLDQKSISIIRNAAESYWNGQHDDENDGGTSRFTYQRKGNCEAHLIDLANHVDGRIKGIVQSALSKSIYPMVKHAFGPLLVGGEKEESMEELNFSVYDSLVIRYNATAALIENSNRQNNSIVDKEEEVFLGAGQPMHRDLGLVSVNIMLNPKQEFEGGGTFLENQMGGGEKQESASESVLELEVDASDLKNEPLKPLGTGHAIAHLSSQRHAGVGTTRGVRDILVLFLTATKIQKETNDEDDTNVSSSSHQHEAPRLERVARLKNSARDNCNHAKISTAEESIFCRMIHYRMALQYAPDDGEAWLYLGMTLRECAKMNMQMNMAVNNENNSPSSSSLLSLSPLKMMELSVSCLEQAYAFNPQDGRLCSNLSLAYETLLTMTPTIHAGSDDDDHYHEQIDFYYRRAMRLHEECERIGCDVSFDYAIATLNYGLYKSNQDNFQDAVSILQRFRQSEKTVKFSKNPEQDRIESDGLKLLEFCERMVK